MWRKTMKWMETEGLEEDTASEQVSALETWIGLGS
jgi:hypothetical protein